MSRDGSPPKANRRCTAAWHLPRRRTRCTVAAVPPWPKGAQTRWTVLGMLRLRSAYPAGAPEALAHVSRPNKYEWYFQAMAHEPLGSPALDKPQVLGSNPSTVAPCPADPGAPVEGRVDRIAHGI